MYCKFGLTTIGWKRSLEHALEQIVSSSVRVLSFFGMTGGHKMNRQNYFRTGLLLALSLSAASAQNSNDVAAYREAGSKFASIVAEAERGAGAKRLQTEEVDGLVAVLSDEKRFLKAERYSVSELNGLVDLCGVSNRAAMSLVFFALKKHIDPKADPQKIAIQLAALVQKNSESFSRHLSYLQPVSIRCVAKVVPPMTELVSSLTPAQFSDVRRAGLQQFRTGVAQLFVGTIQSLGNASNDEAYRLTLAQTLAESAPTLISALPVAVRLQIRSIVSQAGESSLPRFAEYLQTVYKALDDRRCNELCNI